MTKGIYYENSQGIQIRFDDANIRVKESELRDFTWSYSLSHKPSGYGSRLNRFSRSAVEKPIGLVIRGRSREECIATLNKLNAATESDITRKKPGRLFLDGQYLICYLGISSKIDSWRGGFHFLEKTLTILALMPFWYTEVTQAFRAGEVDSSPNGKRYNGRYPYQYGTGYANKILFNDHHSETPAVITMYGPCEDPQIYIARNLYGISGAGASAGERIVLDQLERTIYRVSVTGETTNLFDYRIKSSDQFIPIPSGDVPVQFSGEFGFDVKLMQQRSEPKWI